MAYNSFRTNGTNTDSFLPEQVKNCYGIRLRSAGRGPIMNMETMEDSLLICFSHSSLQELLKDERIVLKMERFGRRIAEYLICCYEERVMSFVTQTPEERYRLLLENGQDLLQKIPQYYVANYLGITPVSLSRIRKRVFASSKKQKLAS
jgi:CRP-like cAMP-binding protein